MYTDALVSTHMYVHVSAVSQVVGKAHAVCLCFNFLLFFNSLVPGNCERTQCTIQNNLKYIVLKIMKRLLTNQQPVT